MDIDHSCPGWSAYPRLWLVPQMALSPKPPSGSAGDGGLQAWQTLRWHQHGGCGMLQAQDGQGSPGRVGVYEGTEKQDIRHRLGHGA